MTDRGEHPNVTAQPVEITQYLRRLITLVEPARTDEAFQVIGEMIVAFHPSLVWDVLTQDVDLPEETPPEIRQYKQRLSPRCYCLRCVRPSTWRAHQRRQDALVHFQESMEKPLSKAPRNEAPTQKQARLLQDVLERIALAQQSGMDSAMNYRQRLYWLQCETEQALVRANRELRFEGGDW